MRNISVMNETEGPEQRARFSHWQSPYILKLQKHGHRKSRLLAGNSYQTEGMNSPVQGFRIENNLSYAKSLKDLVEFTSQQSCAHKQQ